MRVAAWVLLWVVLLAASAWYLWQRLRDLGRRAARLAAQLAQAEELLREMPERREPTPAPDRAAAPLAVFVPAREALRTRRTLRRRAAADRRARRRASWPAWARPVDWTAPDRERRRDEPVP